MHCVDKLQKDPNNTLITKSLYFLCVLLGLLNTKILSPYFNQQFGENISKELRPILMGLIFNIVVLIIIG